MISGNLIRLEKRDFVGFGVGTFTRNLRIGIDFGKDWVDGESLWFLGS